MTPGFTRTLSIALAIGSLTTIAFTQAPAPAPPTSVGVPGDWPTTAANAQRDGWLRGDPYISREEIAKGGFGLQWTLALPASSRPGASITSWTSMGGRKPIAFITDDAGVVSSIDSDTGFDYWRRVFDAGPERRAGCVDGVSSGAVRTMALIPATTGANRGGGFGPAVRPAFHGVIGEPGEGIARELMGPARPPAGTPPSGASPTGSPASGTAAGRGNDAVSGRSMTALAGRGGRGGPQGLHVVAPDGVLHVLGENSGIDVQKPLPFLPPGARPTGLSVVDGIAYVLTSRECGGGVPSGAHAVPLAGENHTVASWESNGAPIGLPAFGTEGTVYVSIAGESRTDGTSNAVVALEPRTLRLKAWFAPGSDAIATGPMVVRHRDRDLVVVAMRSGRLTVLDGASVGGSDHKTTLAQSEPGTAASPRGLASHVDGDGRAWVLMSIDRPAGNGAVVAWTLDDAGGLKEGWTSTGLASPLPPVVVNGVVFVASNGAAAGGFGGAMLQALDPATGRSLWNSGRAMGGAVAGTLLVGNSQVYVATSTRTVFAFGFAMDR